MGKDITVGRSAQQGGKLSALIRNFVIAATLLYAVVFSAIGYMQPSGSPKSLQEGTGDGDLILQSQQALLRNGSVSPEDNAETLSAVPEGQGQKGNAPTEVVKAAEAAAAEPEPPVFVDDSTTLRDLGALQRECQAIKAEKRPGDHSCSPKAVWPDKAWLRPATSRFELPQRGSKEAGQIKISPPDTPQRFIKFDFSCYSQTTEDGVLLALLMAVGVTNKRGLEIAGGVGFENNLANLVVNFGFDAIFFDGNKDNHRCANRFFSTHTSTKGTFGTRRGFPIFRGDYVTRENFNGIIANQTGWSGDIDVFSLDMDSVDYWLWDALDVVNPRIVVVEIQELWGAHEKWTRPYRMDGATLSHRIPSMGASIGAFTYLAEKRGYRLVGCMKEGFNAFFVREDAVPGGIDAIFGKDKYDAEGCFGHASARWKMTLSDRRREAVQDYDWVNPETGEVLDKNTHPKVFQL